LNVERFLLALYNHSLSFRVKREILDFSVAIRHIPVPQSGAYFQSKTQFQRSSLLIRRINVNKPNQLFKRWPALKREIW
jgi:hypothetical protein